ncbi:MAG: PQQ-binding-like beta-propeller repeat protein [Planctomycetota bacterium]
MPHRPAGRRRLVMETAIALVVLSPAFSPSESAAREPPFEAPRFLRDGRPLAAVGQLAPPIAAPAAFQPANVSTRLRRSLMQFRALAADEAWDEALDLVETLRREQGDRLAPIDSLDAAPPAREDADGAGLTLYVPVTQLCQQLVASLPIDGRDACRDRHEAAARRRLDRARDRLDEPAAWRVASESPSTDAAADALLVAAELAMERGDLAAARRGLHAAHPLATDPLGRPAATAMATLHPEASAEALADAWAGSATVEQDGVLAAALARLTLASLRENNLRRAELEHRLLAAVRPDARGRIAGDVRPLARTLGEMLSDAIGSTGDRGSAERVADTLVPVWPQPSSIAAAPPVGRSDLNPAWPANAAQQRLLLGGRAVLSPTRQAAGSSRTGPAVAVVGSVAYYCQAGDLMRLDLLTGRAQPGPSLFEEPPAQPGRDRPALGDLAGDGMAGGVANPGPGRLLLGQQARPVFGAGVIAPGRVVGRTVASEPVAVGALLAVRVNDLGRERLRRPGRAQPSSESLVVFSTAREPQRRFTVAPSEGVEEGANAAEYRFAGPPAIAGDRLLLPVERRSSRRSTTVVCVSADDGRSLWRTDLGATQRLGSARSVVISRGDTVYALTGDGGLAALDASDGAIRWLLTHPRASTTTRGAPVSTDRLAVFGDHVVLAPAGAGELIAIDASTGGLLWRTPIEDRAATLLAIHRSAEGASILIAGDRVASHDLLTGERRFRWPDAARSGIRGLGAGALVGDELFWPTRDAIYAVHPTTGAPTRPPIGLRSLGSAGATVVPAGGGLLVCGPERAQWLAPLESPHSRRRPEPKPRLSRFMERDHPPLAQVR